MCALYLCVVYIFFCTTDEKQLKKKNKKKRNKLQRCERERRRCFIVCRTKTNTNQKKDSDAKYRHLYIVYSQKVSNLKDSKSWIHFNRKKKMKWNKINGVEEKSGNAIVTQARALLGWVCTVWEIQNIQYYKNIHTYIP